MSSSNYHQARAELRKLIVTALETELGKTESLESIPPSFQPMLDAKGDELLDQFEGQCDRRGKSSFWRGVFQSLVGTALGFVLLALAAMILTGFRVNPFELLSAPNQPTIKSEAQQDGSGQPATRPESK
jgi:hypothetical protein